jgi:hypothetical protein
MQISNNLSVTAIVALLLGCAGPHETASPIPQATETRAMKLSREGPTPEQRSQSHEEVLEAARTLCNSKAQQNRQVVHGTVGGPEQIFGPGVTVHFAGTLTPMGSIATVYSDLTDSLGIQGLDNGFRYVGGRGIILVGSKNYCFGVG